MTRPVHRRTAAPTPLSDDAFETSQLLLELIHAAYATRAAEARTAATGEPGGREPGGPGHARSMPSTHAIRAAIHVYQHGERTIGELAAGLGISYGWASRVVSELESAGMVQRRPDPSDRRIVRVLLTPEAMDMVVRTYRWRGEAVERALAGLDARGRRTVADFLRRATVELSRMGASETTRAH